MTSKRSASPWVGLCVVPILLLLLLPIPAKAASFTELASYRLVEEQYTTVWAVAVGDTDRDGLNEVLAAYDMYASAIRTPRLLFLAWNGRSFDVEDALEGVSLARDNTLDAPRHIGLGDLDGDGQIEITFTGEAGGIEGVHVYRWDGTGYAQVDSVAGSFRDIAVGDGDGDGDLEVYAIRPGHLEVYEWVRDRLILTADVPLSNAARPSLIAVGNADDDEPQEILIAEGDLDFAAFEWSGSEYLPDGSGAVDFGYMSHGIGVGDVDGDGTGEVVRMDYHRNIVVYGRSGSAFQVEWSGTSTAEAQNTITAGEVFDADGDGQPEILVGHGNTGRDSIVVFQHDGAAYAEEWNSGARGYVHVIAPGDVDNDGFPELLTGSGSGGTLRVYSAGGSELPSMAVRTRVDPALPRVGEPIQIVANTNGIPAALQVRLEVRSTTGPFALNTSLAAQGSGRWLETVTVPEAGTYTFAVHASGGGAGAWSNGTFRVVAADDTTPPTILHSPWTSGPSDVPIPIRASVHDASGISQVWAVYVDGAGVSQGTRLSCSGEACEGRLSAPTGAGMVEYTILAADMAGNWATHGPHAMTLSPGGFFPVEIFGRVAGPEGPVPGARVDLLDDQGRTVASGHTNATGAFTLTEVPPGNRFIRVTATGFAEGNFNVGAVAQGERRDVGMLPLKALPGLGFATAWVIFLLVVLGVILPLILRTSSKSRRAPTVPGTVEPAEDSVAPEVGGSFSGPPCPSCGRAVRILGSFCPHCGTPLDGPPPT